MNPAEELTAAADKLDALLAGTAPNWTLTDSNHLALPVIEMPYMVGPLKGQPGYTVTGPNDRTTQYIAAMDPLVGKALTDLLRKFSEAYARETRPFHAMWSEAARERMIGDRMDGFTQALALARLINGSAT